MLDKVGYFQNMLKNVIVIEFVHHHFYNNLTSFEYLLHDDLLQFSKSKSMDSIKNIISSLGDLCNNIDAIVWKACAEAKVV